MLEEHDLHGNDSQIIHSLSWKQRAYIWIENIFNKYTKMERVIKQY